MFFTLSVPFSLVDIKLNEDNDEFIAKLKDGKDLLSYQMTVGGARQRERAARELKDLKGRTEIATRTKPLNMNL